MVVRFPIVRPDPGGAKTTPHIATLPQPPLARESSHMGQEYNGKADAAEGMSKSLPARGRRGAYGVYAGLSARRFSSTSVGWGAVGRQGRIW